MDKLDPADRVDLADRVDRAADRAASVDGEGLRAGSVGREDRAADPGDRVADLADPAADRAADKVADRMTSSEQGCAA